MGQWCCTGAVRPALANPGLETGDSGRVLPGTLAVPQRPAQTGTGRLGNTGSAMFRVGTPWRLRLRLAVRDQGIAKAIKKKIVSYLVEIKRVLWNAWKCVACHVAMDGEFYAFWESRRWGSIHPSCWFITVARGVEETTENQQWWCLLYIDMDYLFL